MVKQLKRVKQLLVFAVLIVLLFIIIPVDVHAKINGSIFNDSVLNESDEESEVSVSYEKENAGSIQNYDVSASGKLLICLKGNQVNVYDENGKFEYAIQYDTSGKSFCFWWDDKIVIYIVRGTYCMVFDHTETEVYDFTGDIRQLILNVSARVQYYNDFTYYVEEPLSILDDSLGYKLIKTEKTSGEQETVYNNKNAMRETITLNVFIFGFIILWIIGIIVAIFKIKESGI